MAGTRLSRWTLRALCGMFLLAPFLLLTAAPAQARHAAAPLARGASSSTSTGHVTVIVLDMSGSMTTNDPNGLRCSAANAYIDLSGPNQYVGVIGLDNNDGQTGGAHGFQLAQVWAQPTEMATESQRHGMIQTIQQKSNSCRPDGNTPTYDALAQALQMLTAATVRSGSNGAKTTLGGSVILLTDGAPYPNQDEQESAVLSDLAPKFAQNGWPVDTVALGTDTSFFGFLNDIASATSGKFYTDGQGVVPGQASALNIAPFFVQIFAQRVGRVLGPTIDPVQLDGGTTSRDFQLADYVDHLDVIVIKDTPDTTVTLTDPNGQTLPPEIAGTFISTDPHYAIFSIDGPQKGTWTVTVSGAGLMLMDSLVVSALKVNLTAPDASIAFLPLGQDFQVSATINYQGTQITGGAYDVKGTITYSGVPAPGQQAFGRDLNLSDSGHPGEYATTVNVPLSAPVGTYTIDVVVRQGSKAVISEDTRTLRLELFPAPLLIPPLGGAPTSDAVSANVVRWDAGLQTIYSAPLGIGSALSAWPLGSLPARPSADIHGVVELQGVAQSNVTVTGTAVRNGTKQSVPITVVNDGKGHFHVVFPAAVDGVYTVTFYTSGTYKQSHFDANKTIQTVRLTVVNPTLRQSIIAWLITLLYLFLLIAFLNLFVRPFVPRPAGAWSSTGPSGSEAGNFAQARRRGLLRWYFRRNVLTSREAFGEPGLRLVFHGPGDVTPRRRGHGRALWQFGDDASTLIYDPVGDATRLTTYTIDSSGLVEDDDEYARGRSWRRGNEEEDDDDDRPRVRGRRRRDEAENDRDLYAEERATPRRARFGRRRDDDDD